MEIILLLFRFLNWLFRLSLNNLNWGTESITVLCQLDLFSEWTVTKFLGKNSDWLCEWIVADNVKKCGNLKQNTNPFRLFFQFFFFLEFGFNSAHQGVWLRLIVLFLQHQLIVMLPKLKKRMLLYLGKNCKGSLKILIDLGSSSMLASILNDPKRILARILRILTNILLGSFLLASNPSRQPHSGSCLNHTFQKDSLTFLQHWLPRRTA